MIRRGAVHACFQYYPDPARYQPVTDFTTLRGLFWYRRRGISPDLVFRLCHDTDFHRFIVHEALDPDNESQTAWSAPANIRHVDRIHWSDDGEAYGRALSESNVFFAPRPCEGIGMSVLEAMASGHCVVACDAPTMNEYIAHGTNGLLYAPARPAAVDFANARAVGARARESVERGYQRWQTSIPKLLEFVFTPTAKWRTEGRTTIPAENSVADASRATTRPGLPLVSVVIVCRNAAPLLPSSIDSVLRQRRCAVELIVLDRQSDDGNSEILRNYTGRLSICHAAADAGRFQAMNLVLDMARGIWVMFIDAGEVFASDDALCRAFAQVPSGFDVVYGHTAEQGLHHAADFETSWQRLQSGDLGPDWLAGLPAPSVAIRRELATKLQFETGFRFAGELDLMFRARIGDAAFFNCDEVITIAPPEGRGYNIACYRKELAMTARQYGNVAAVDSFFASIADTRTIESRFVRLGRLALQALALLDQHAPLVANAADRILRSRTVYKAVRRLFRPAGSVPPAQSQRPGCSAR